MTSSAAVLAVFRSKTRRALLFTMVSIPGTLAMAAWKAALFVIAPSYFLLATVVFTLGVAVAKAGIIRSHVVARRREAAGSPVDVPEVQRRAYRTTGLLVLALSALFALSFVPQLTGTEGDIAYERPVAIVIAAITFGELGLAVHGTVSARRNRDLLAEAVKLTNVAAGLVLLPLTQSALLSIDPDIDAGVANAFSGILFGSLAAGVGAWMLWRSRSAVGPDRDAGAARPVAHGQASSVEAASPAR